MKAALPLRHSLFVAFLAAFYWLNVAFCTTVKTDKHLHRNSNIVLTTFSDYSKVTFIAGQINQNNVVKRIVLSVSLRKCKYLFLYK